MTYKVLITFILTSIAFNYSNACELQSPREINAHIDLNKNLTQNYTKNRLIDEPAYLLATNCDALAARNQYLMIALGLENIVLTNETIGFNFTPQPETLDCKLKNNPFNSEQTKDDRFFLNKNKRDFFNECITLRVTEMTPNLELEFVDGQPGCKAKFLSKNSADLKGAYCFLKPKRASELNIQIAVEPKCAKALSQNYLAHDLSAIVNTYVAGDATGFSQDLTALTTTSFRLSLSKEIEKLPMSEDLGTSRPRWPTTWTMSDLAFGKLKTSTLDNANFELMLPLVVNNQCQRVCESGFCSSPCHYSQPVVGEYSLYEIKGGKREFIKLWYDGSVASPQYQGMLFGAGVSVPKISFENGKTYEIEAIFREPDLDFSYFTGQIQRQMRLANNTIGPISRAGEINHVPLINTIDNIGHVLEIPLIQNLSFENHKIDGLARVLQTWQNRINNNFWPPLYEKKCVNGRCQNAEISETRLIYNFQANITDDGDLTVKNSHVIRKSSLVSHKQWYEDTLPYVDCGINIDDGGFDWGDIL